MVRIKKFFVRLLCCLIPVRNWRHKVRSYFAIPLGVRYLDEQKFFEYINGKTVAVVGNGPQQIGKHTGAEIDSADIVVRFNTFELDGYTDDYGTRTDVWVNAAGAEYKEKKYVKLAKKCKYVIWRYIPFGMEREKPLMAFYRRCFWAGKKIDIFPCQKHTECESNTIWGNKYPTVGCVFLWYLKTYAKPKQIKIYGFSFTDPTLSVNELSKMPHFYHKRETGGTHNMSIEIVFLQNLFKDEIKKGKI